MSARYEQSENKRFKKIFTMWVGSFGLAPDGEPKMTVEELSTYTGITINTVKGHLRHDGTMPNWSNLKLYSKALPIGFMNSLLHDCGVKVVQAEEHETTDGSGLMADMAGRVADLAEDLRDGIHTDAERAAIAPKLIKLGGDCTILGHSWLDGDAEASLKEVA